MTKQSLHTENSDVYGNTSGSNVDASGGLYGAGKFGYSINDVSSSELTITVEQQTQLSLHRFQFLGQMLTLNQTYLHKRR